MICDLKGHIICLYVELTDSKTVCRFHNRTNYHCGRCHAPHNGYDNMQEFVEEEDAIYQTVPKDDDETDV